MSYSYQTEQWLPFRVEDVFSFFADPNNLPLLMPRWQKARIEQSTIVPPPGTPPEETTKAAGAGSKITLSFRPVPFSPIRLQWEAEITEFVWNSHFADTQVRGPFASWHHTHRLRSVDRYGIDVTVIVDRVDYDVPFGAAGKLLHSFFMRRQIERIFAFRQSEIDRIFRSNPPEARKASPHPVKQAG